MTRVFSSLRGRLVCAMLLVFGLGLTSAVLVDPPDSLSAASDSWTRMLSQEPYQDFLVLIPYTAATVALMWIVSAWSLRQISRASRQASRIGPGAAQSRIATDRLPSEVQPLVEAFNGALDRLAEAYQAEQHLVAQVAHQLRTPLAVLSLRVQRARSGASLDLDAFETDLRNVNAFISRLLDLARKEHARRGSSAQSRPPVNLSRLAREVAADIMPLFAQAGRELIVTLPPSLPTRGERVDLGDMLINLLDNALRHGKGEVCLSGQAAERRGRRWAELTVSDDGSGIAPELRRQAFDRFARGDAQSQGHGLGLAIVKEVAEGHGGSVEIVDAPGCCLQVMLPLQEESVVEETLPSPAALAKRLA